MPRFYFQVIENGVKGPIDATGLEYSSLDAAERDAAAIAARIMDGALPVQTQTLEVVISDERRQPLSRVTVTLTKDRLT